MANGSEEFLGSRILERTTHQEPGGAYQEIRTAEGTFYQPLPWEQATYWQNKEISYRKTFSFNSWSIEVIGFNERELNQAQEQEIEEFFAEAPDGFAKHSPFVKAILLDDELLPHEPTDAGWGSYFGDRVRFTPRTITASEYRIPGISPIKAVLAHEFMEANIYPGSESELVKLWAEQFGFSKNGQDDFTICQQPERCITAYAQKSAEEDLCESMVAFLYSPDKLDQGKRSLLEQLEFRIVRK
jgi:hypothetical protein